MKATKPPDPVEINGGTWPACGGSEPDYFTESHLQQRRRTRPAPSDESLGAYVEEANRFEGVTHLVLNGSTNTINVTTVEGGKNRKNISWPANGLIYVQETKGRRCEFKYKVNEADTASDRRRGKLRHRLRAGHLQQIAHDRRDERRDRQRQHLPTSVAGKLGTAPTGVPTLGLIATDFVRIYHPCSGGTNGTGSIEPLDLRGDPVDHPLVPRRQLQLRRDPGQPEHLRRDRAEVPRDRRQVGSHGYLKEYIYDERVATDEPPYFLSPLKTGWKIARETSPTGG